MTIQLVHMVNLCHRCRLPPPTTNNLIAKITISTRRQNNRLFEKITFTNTEWSALHCHKYLRLCLSWPNDIMQSSDNHHHHHFIVSVCKMKKKISTHIKKVLIALTLLSRPQIHAHAWCDALVHHMNMNSVDTQRRIEEEKKWTDLLNHLRSKALAMALLFRAPHIRATYLSHAILLFFRSLSPWFLMPFRVVSVHMRVRQRRKCWVPPTKASLQGETKRKKKISFSYGWYFTAASTFAFFHTHYVNFSHFSPPICM